LAGNSQVVPSEAMLVRVIVIEDRRLSLVACDSSLVQSLHERRTTRNQRRFFDYDYEHAHEHEELSWRAKPVGAVHYNGCGEHLRRVVDTTLEHSVTGARAAAPTAF